MIEPALPGKETVQITLPTRQPAETASEDRDAGRINSLIRPSNEIVASRVMPHSDPGSPWARNGGASPDTETSRISVLPRPAKASASFPTIVRNTADKRAAIDTVPKPLCWALVGVSAGVLLLEIWNYIS